ASTVTYALSLHDALPISRRVGSSVAARSQSTAPARPDTRTRSSPESMDTASSTSENERMSSASTSTFPETLPVAASAGHPAVERSEEHTSELQSRENLVC